MARGGILPATLSNHVVGSGAVDPFLRQSIVISNLDPALAGGGFTHSVAGGSVENNNRSTIHNSSTINIQQILTSDNLRTFDQGLGRDTQTV